LIATAEHDDVFNELENDNLLNDQGGPIDFKETSFDLTLSKRLIGMAETKSAFTAFLIYRHLQFVHGSDPKADAYLKELGKREPSWIKWLDVLKKKLDVLMIFRSFAMHFPC